MTIDGVTSEARRVGLLTGVRILDLTSVVMGPYATQILGDLGAEVIMVEPPEGGVLRVMGPGTHPELSGIALNLLRNKRAVVLDLKRPEGRAALLRIASTCDVVVTTMRLRALTKLGLTFDDVVAVQPNLVWCAAHGYRESSGDADLPAYDDIIQAQSGFADLMHEWTGEYSFVPSVIADKVCGMTIAYSILGALLKQRREGGPVRIEVPMLDTMRSFLCVEHGVGAINIPRVGEPGYLRVLARSRRPFATADGWLAVLPYSLADWRAVFRVAERPDLEADPRLSSRASVIEHAASLYVELAELLAAHPSSYWEERLAEAGIAFGSVVSLTDVVDSFPNEKHPVAGAYKHVPVPTVCDDAPVELRPAPTLGEHTREVLSEVGLSDSQISDLLEPTVAS